MNASVAPSPPSVDLRWEVAQRVASSVVFHRSPRLRELLIYVCERSIQNRPEELREQAIGCGVFGRKADYNPGEDNIVRVEIRQLRKRLDDYFASEGKDEPYVIQIPKGSYVPVFEPRLPVSELTISNRPVASKPVAAGISSRPWWFWAQILALMVLAIACVAMWRANREVEKRLAAVARAIPERPPLWPLLFNDNQETFVVCADSTLVVAESIMHRSISLDQYLAGDNGALTQPNDLASLVRSLAYSRKRWQFTDMTDVRLVQRLYRLNVANWDKVSVQSSRTMKIQDFKNGNVVLLGSNRSNLWNSLFEPMLKFRFDYDEQARMPVIRNQSPEPGEPTSYRAARPGETGDSYGVVALVPNLRHTGSVLIIEGTTAEGTEAAGEFIMNSATSAALLNSLMKRNKDHIPYFEVLLRSSTLEGIAKNAQIVAERTLPDEMPRN
jgi:hypothetical protein